MQLYIDVSGGDIEETAPVTEIPTVAEEEAGQEEETYLHTVSDGDTPNETYLPSPSPTNDSDGDMSFNYVFPVQESESYFDYTVSSGNAQPEVSADSSALLTELTGVNERLTLIISLLVFAGLWCIGKLIYKFLGWFF